MSVVESTWSTILAEPHGRAGIVGRRVSPVGAIEIWAALERPADTPLVFMSAASPAFRVIRDLPRAAGFAVTLDPGGNPTHTNLILSLREARFRTLFGVLAEDVVQHAIRHADHESAIAAFVSRLRRWQAFIGRHGHEGLTPAEQQGLFAELWALRGFAIPRAGSWGAVAAWMGPAAASHDFQFTRASVEVKSSSGVPPFHVRVASCVQLDESDVPALLLLHVALEKRAAGAEDLPAIVASVRALVRGDEPAADLLEEKLVDAGYLDVHAPIYRGTEYRVLAHKFFHVRDDFPRLRVATIPDGVHDVTYSLALEACGRWSISDADALPVFEAPDV